MPIAPFTMMEWSLAFFYFRFSTLADEAVDEDCVLSFRVAVALVLAGFGHVSLPNFQVALLLMRVVVLCLCSV